jgi:N-acetylglucosaminyldiphosphoundecaprenol N-acetyl-beta-D-mannosaminyltransferase
MDRSKRAPAPMWTERKLACLAGLPVDAVSMHEAVALVRLAVINDSRLFISTPNLNFLIAAQSDPAFRESVLVSQLSLADGMSLALLSRLLGARLPERVTGSDLFENLARSKDHPPLKVFFFGGLPGVGKMAAERLNREYPGMQCVGVDEAGYGDVKSMSSQGVIDRINQSNADLLVVALGARKGQAWIIHNQSKLQVPVISHLGAVINFVAGTVLRAPPWAQYCGLEWAWRITQEPQLWKRYRDDGTAFLQLIFKKLLPALLVKALTSSDASVPGSAQVQDMPTGNPPSPTLTMAGHWCEGDLPKLNKALEDFRGNSLRVNLHDATHLSNRVWGALLGLHGQMLASGGRGLFLTSPSASTKRELALLSLHYLQEASQGSLSGVQI